MKHDTPGFVRKLPVIILILAVILVTVFRPIYRHYKKKAEELRTAEDQEIAILDEIVEDAPRSVDEPESNGDSDDSSD